MSISEREVFKNIGFLIQEGGRVSLDRGSFDRLLEQAKRVQDLEEFVSSIEWQTKTLKKRQGEINRLKKQNKRYREAIYNAERKCDGEASSILKQVLESDE